MRKVDAYIIIETDAGVVQQTSVYPLMDGSAETYDKVVDCARSHFKQIIQNIFDDEKEWKTERIEDWQKEYPQVKTDSDILEIIVNEGYFEHGDDEYNLVWGYAFIVE